MEKITFPNTIQPANERDPQESFLSGIIPSKEDIRGPVDSIVPISRSKMREFLSGIIPEKALDATAQLVTQTPEEHTAQERVAAELATTPVGDGRGRKFARMTGRSALTLGVLVPGLLLAGGAGIFAGTFRALDTAGVSPYATKTTPFDIKYFLTQYDRLTTKKKAA